MTMVQIAYLGVIFILVAAAAFALMRALAPRPTKARLDVVAAEDATPREKTVGGWEQTIIELAGPLAKLALPSEGWENSVLRTRFIHAGYHARSVPLVYFAAKTVLALALPAVLLVCAGLSRLELGDNITLAALLGLAALGYYIPNVVLARLIALRQRELFESFPDAVDLMTVCVEAGLGLDAAMARVGEEMRAEESNLGRRASSGKP